jgi:DNA invertase Pin-like site-specific DNA recombinase
MTVSNGGSLLRQWRDADARPRRRGRQTVQAVGELRFAFYGRFSTKEHQDSNSSRRWQLECADQVIAGFGSIVAEFLDVGVTRRRSWVNRPQAAALLDAVTAGAPGFDAVVVGEYERAFCGRQAFEIIALLHEHGIQLWLPETLGPVDLGDPAHRAVLIEIGARSMREIQRDRHRAIEAMSAQAAIRAAIWAADPRMDTCWLTPGRIRPPATPAGAGSNSVWPPTRQPLSTCGGSSRARMTRARRHHRFGFATSGAAAGVLVHPPHQAAGLATS